MKGLTWLTEFEKEILFFFPVQLEFEHKKTFDRVYSEWERQDLSHIHSQARAALRNVITNYNHLLNDHIYTCLVQDWRQVEMYVKELEKRYRVFKKEQHVSDFVNNYTTKWFKHDVMSFCVEDIKELQSRLGPVDIGHLLTLYGKQRYD